MNSEDLRLQAKAQARIDLHKTLVRTAMVSTCLNCDNWDKPTKQCGKFQQTPPPDIIMYGCEFWENEIPF